MTMAFDPDCLFCKMVNGTIPIKPVFETDTVLAFDDIDPKAPVHTLVIPKTHVSSVATCGDPQLAGQVMLAAAEVAHLKGVADSGYRLVTNTGVDGGQSVFHWHVHVLGGRSMQWPPG